MADAIAQKKNLAQAQQSGLLNSKRFEIKLSNAKNEPLLTLEYLHSFIGSLVDAFKIGSKKAHNPSPSILKIIAGSEVITHQDIEFSIGGLKQEDASISGRGLSHIKSTLYPEDVISIIDYLRQWLAKYYSQETREYSWAIQVSTLQQKWRSSVERRGENTITNSIADFAQGNLQKAVEELFIKIEEILKSKTQDVEYDSIDDLVNEIKKEFAKEPEETWERVGLVLTDALAKAKINTPAVLIPNKNLKVSDVRLSINAIYDQIANQLEKTSGPEKPWDRVSDSTKTKFNSHQAYFSTDEIKKENVVNNDSVKSKKFIEWIEQLLEELKKEPEKEEVAAEKVEVDESEGEGGSEETIDEQTDFFTQEEIAKKAIDYLTMRSGKAFLAYFSGTAIDPNQLNPKQRDWLLTKLPGHIQDLLDQKSIQQKFKNEINNWISTNLESENEEKNHYKISADQSKKLESFLAEQFFIEYTTQFLKWMGTVPSVDELEKSEPAKVETPPKEAIVPPTAAETAEPTQVRGEAVDRNKFIRDTTTGFLGLYFGTEGEAFRETEGEAFRKLAQDYIAKYTPKTLTTADLLKLRLKLLNELRLDKDFYNSTQNYYQQKLAQLGLDDDQTRLNIDNTLDSILVLAADPREYLTHLSDDQLIGYFGLEGKQIDVAQFRSTLLELIFIRRAHYLINGTSIKPWLGKQKEEETSQYLTHVRSFINKAGEDGAMALNLDEDGIDKATIDQKRKELIKKLYQELWINTVAGKSPEEIEEIYEFYGVGIIEIDFNTLPAPDGFIYSDMAQHANLDSPTLAQNRKANFAKRLFSKGKGKLGKLALTALAPELAPILATLEKLPIIGDIVKKAEEKAGNLILKVGGAITAGLAILIGFITKSLGAILASIAVSSIIGGIVGSIFGPWGTVVGIGIGGGIGGLIGKGSSLKEIGGLFKGSGGTGTGVGAKASFGAGAKFSPAIPPALVPATIGGTMAGSALMIATTGASMLHPIPNASDVIPDAELNISKYVELSKTADITKIENNQNTTITYTIIIAPKDEYIIKINTVETKDEWSYLGGDSINLPNQTQKILEQIGEESLNDSVTVTYSVDMSGVDVAVSNNFILNFEAVDEIGAVIDTDSISAFETVIIGEPEIGCLVPGAAGEEWGGVPTLSWSGSNWNRVLNILAKRAGTSTQFMSLVCAGDTPLQTFLLKGGFAEGYGGWAPSSFGGAKVGLYEYGLSFKESSLEYTLVHELGHIIDYRNPGLRQQYLQVLGGDSRCYTYPFPSMCSGAEAFAESVALYVVHKTYYFSYTGHGYFDFPGKYPNQYEWLKNNVFGGVEFK